MDANAARDDAGQREELPLARRRAAGERANHGDDLLAESVRRFLETRPKFSAELYKRLREALTGSSELWGQVTGSGEVRWEAPADVHWDVGREG